MHLRYAGRTVVSVPKMLFYIRLYCTSSVGEAERESEMKVGVCVGGVREKNNQQMALRYSSRLYVFRKLT